MAETEPLPPLAADELARLIASGAIAAMREKYPEPMGHDSGGFVKTLRAVIEAEATRIIEADHQVRLLDPTKIEKIRRGHDFDRYDGTHAEVGCLGIMHLVDDIHEGIEEAVGRGFTLDQINEAMKNDLEVANYSLGFLGDHGCPSIQQGAEEALRKLVEGRPT